MRIPSDGRACSARRPRRRFRLPRIRPLPASRRGASLGKAVQVEHIRLTLVLKALGCQPVESNIPFKLMVSDDINLHPYSSGDESDAALAETARGGAVRRKLDPGLKAPPVSNFDCEKVQQYLSNLKPGFFLSSRAPLHSHYGSPSPTRSSSRRTTSSRWRRAARRRWSTAGVTALL